MSQSQLADFEALIGEFCLQHGLDQQALRSESMGVVSYALLADGAEAAIFYLPGPGQSHFNALIDAGPAPAMSDKESWSALLELDFSMVSSLYDACFCCDLSKTRLQLRMVFRLGDADAGKLAGALSDGVKAVRTWQSSAEDACAPLPVGDFAIAG